MADRKLSHVDPGVNVPSSLFSERPLEGTALWVAEKSAKSDTQLAGACARKLDRPVIVGPLRASEPRREPFGAMLRDGVEA
jgi:hypothetical protein